MKKITEHTYGSHIYMKLEIDDKIEEIDVYVRSDGWTYKTTGDNDHMKRQQIIDAFNTLY